jgi:hypothetical protein
MQLLEENYLATAFNAILIKFEGQFQIFQRFASSTVVLKPVKSRSKALNYSENGSTMCVSLSSFAYMVFKT